MGKGDKKEAKTAANTARDTNTANMNQGIGETASRAGELTGRSDRERTEAQDAYRRFNSTSASDYLKTLSGGVTGGGGGVGGSGGGGLPVNKEDYVGVWEELMGKTGGFDPTRLSNVTSDAANLRDFASRGGITDADRKAVNRDTLLEFERTGGYSDSDIANIRSRANSAVPAHYQNLKESLERRRGAGNFSGPGIDRAGFKLARQAAQQHGETARDTEIGISDAVRAGRSDASKFLSGANLDLAGLTSRNTLEGYKGAAGIDTGTQQLINQSRLGASTAKAQDARSRDAIGASSGAAAAARADANARWAAQMEQEDRMFGARGLTDMYSARPEELVHNQNLLRGYRNDQMEAGQYDFGNRERIGYMPGLMDDIKKGVGIGVDLAGIGGSIFGAFDGGGRGGNTGVAGNTMNDNGRRRYV